MKKQICLFSAALLLTGCAAQPAASSQTAETTQTMEQTTAQTTEQTTAPAETTAAPETTTTAETTAAPEVNAQYFGQCSEKMVEAAPEEILEPREGVTYPTFQKYSYYSTTCERNTNVNVLLPADYDPEKKYPVLYILHGSNDDENWMARDEVGLSVMLNNLIADGEAREMIVVSPYIYCSLDGSKCVGLKTEDFLNFDRFRDEMEADLMPFIEQKFSIAKGRENTAVTGFSIGGRESLNLGFTYPEQFGYIGSICTASGVVKDTGEPYILEPEQFCFTENKPYLLLLSASTIDGAVGDIPFGYHDILEENGTEHLWHVMNETGHEVGSVISHMYNFYRMVFQATE